MAFGFLFLCIVPCAQQEGDGEVCYLGVVLTLIKKKLETNQD